MSYYFDPTLNNTFGATATVTGAGATGQNRFIVMQFDQYEIVLAVTEDNRVLAVTEVRQKKDFRNVQQKIASAGAVGMERFVTE
jgi:hypothetical protein